MPYDEFRRAQRDWNCGAIGGDLRCSRRRVRPCVSGGLLWDAWSSRSGRCRRHWSSRSYCCDGFTCHCSSKVISAGHGLFFGPLFVDSVSRGLIWIPLMKSTKAIFEFLSGSKRAILAGVISLAIAVLLLWWIDASPTLYLLVILSWVFHVFVWRGNKPNP